MTAFPQLNTQQVHVWWMMLEESLSSEAWTVLSDDERQRAEQMADNARQSQFVQTRYFCRALLSSYLQCEPDELRFSYSSLGKPQVAFPQSDKVFNVAHSGNLVCMAIARAECIGIDIEQHRSMDWNRLSARFFSPAEVDYLATLTPDDARSAFFDIWVNKEAYLKAQGKGVFQSMSSFTVSPESERPSEWTFAKTVTPKGYSSAVVLPKGPYDYFSYAF